MYKLKKVAGFDGIPSLRHQHHPIARIASIIAGRGGRKRTEKLTTMSVARNIQATAKRSTLVTYSPGKRIVLRPIRYLSTEASTTGTSPASNVASTSGNHNPSGQPEKRQTTHFGFQTVDANAKEGLVKGVFSNVASKYDVMNDAMSLGVHRLWKDAFVAGLDPGRRGALRCLDVAGGTGDIALRILDHARENWYDRETSVEVVDINPEMLAEGKKRFKLTMYHNSERQYPFSSSSINPEMLQAPQVSFREGNAQKLDLPSDTYDLYTIAFGIRNCTSVPDVLKEAYRVLKPGGTFACLEFSRVNNPLLSTCVPVISFLT